MTTLRHKESGELSSIIDKQLASLPLTAHEVERLQVLLKDPLHMRHYLESMELEASMPDAVENADLEELVSSPKKTARYRWPLAIGAAAAAFILFAAGRFSAPEQKPSIALEISPATTEISTHKHAQITGMFGVRWTETADNALHPEKIRIDSGLVELTYETGVSVVIEGPADYCITGSNDGVLAYGKFVANVPKGAEGFTVDYPMGKVVDLGTEFGVDLSQKGDLSVGVFKGKVELHTKGSDHVSLIEEDHALNHSPNSPDTISSIPFDRDSYVRSVPSREFSWSMDSKLMVEKSFDVSHLMWKPGGYRVVIKWMFGAYAAKLSHASLWLDDQLITEDLHRGVTGKIHLTQDNIYNLKVEPKDYEKGKWMLKVRFTPLLDDSGREMDTQGTLLFEEGLAFKATTEDFIGRWQYTHDGNNWERHIHPDKTIDLYKNGVLQSGFKKSQWLVENGIMKVEVPDIKEFETHLLRDAKTMIFINKNYRNAIKTEQMK